MTAWIVACVLAVATLLFISLYHRAISETRGVSYLLLMTLLKEDVYRTQKQSLIDLVRTTSAKNALGLPVSRALAEMGAGARNSGLGTYGHLWKLKQELSQTEISN